MQLACSILSRSDSCQGDGRQRHLMMHGQCPIPVYSSQVSITLTLSKISIPKRILGIAIPSHSFYTTPALNNCVWVYIITFAIVCLTQVWQSLLPRFCDKTFEFAIQTWQASLEHYYVYVQTYFLSKLLKMLILLISSYCKMCTLSILRSRVCLLRTIQTREIVLLAMDTFYNGT